MRGTASSGPSDSVDERHLRAVVRDLLLPADGIRAFDAGPAVKNPLFALTIGRFAAIIATFAGLAQLVEQLICNQQVGGSSPSTSSTPAVSMSRTAGFSFL